MATKRMALGKGLGALLPEFGQAESKALLYCGIEEILPNRSQPRKHFDESKIEELAASIKEKGVLEPLIVRRTDQGYELIVGERRWRAAQKAGLKEVPVLVKEVEGREALEISLVENLQREDLNPLEAAGFQTPVRRVQHQPGGSEQTDGQGSNDHHEYSPALKAPIGSEKLSLAESHHFRTRQGDPQPREQREAEGTLCPDCEEGPFGERGRSHCEAMVRKTRKTTRLFGQEKG